MGHVRGEKKERDEEREKKREMMKKKSGDKSICRYTLSSLERVSELELDQNQISGLE